MQQTQTQTRGRLYFGPSTASWWTEQRVEKAQLIAMTLLTLIVVGGFTAFLNDWSFNTFQEKIGEEYNIFMLAAGGAFEIGCIIYYFCTRTPEEKQETGDNASVPSFYNKN